MKRALTKNWGLKLLAFVFSVLLWIIVMNIEDPVDERTFSGIQVTVTHPEIVTNPGNTYQILDDSRTISVTVKAKRSILNKIKTDDIRATADMKNLDVRTRSLIPIDISIPSRLVQKRPQRNPYPISLRPFLFSSRFSRLLRSRRISLARSFLCRISSTSASEINFVVFTA